MTTENLKYGRQEECCGYKMPTKFQRAYKPKDVVDFINNYLYSSHVETDQVALIKPNSNFTYFLLLFETVYLLRHWNYICLKS